MSSHCSNEVPFRFYKSQLVTTDAEKSFHDIRLNQKEPLYIQLNFRDAKQNALYVAILEDNPFVPEDYFITNKDREYAKRLLDKVIYDYQRNALQTEIDQALDEKDQQKFTELVKRLHNLERKNPFQPKLLRQ